MPNSDLKKLSMNELAAWSSWPARLLSIDSFQSRDKSPESVSREFGNDKWGSLLSHFSDITSFKLSDVQAMEQDLDELIPCFERVSNFHLALVREAGAQQIDIYKNTLIPHVAGASGLVELGAGYGSKLFELSDLSPLNKLPLYAAEYTQSGCDLTKLIAKRINKQVQVGQCDFNTLDLIGLEIPENAIIFTSYSVHYVSELREDFVNFILQFKPKVIVHFEPCYEYYDPQTLHGLMCQRYMELNGYTKNIASNIEAGCLKIGAKFRSDRNIFGSNPFLPFSIIQWEPQYLKGDTKNI